MFVIKGMAHAKRLIHYILSAFSMFTLTPDTIKVDHTSTVESAWKNVGGYIRNAMQKHESELR